MRLGTPGDLLLAFVAWGVLAAMLDALYERTGSWALLAFVLPTLLARQALKRSQMFIEADRAHRRSESAFLQLTQQIDYERNDERRLIAGDLHDDVLQVMFKVNLMAHVLRRDLDREKLAEMEKDLQDLHSASDLAVENLRRVITDLRRSDLGRGGLPSALSRLVSILTNQTSMQIQSSIRSIEADSVLQLVLYQIAREALNNALVHSRAKQVHLELDLAEDDCVRLSVRDDGVGFDTSEFKDGHFGVTLMRERAQSIGATLYIDSSIGEGCRVTVVARRRNPADRSEGGTQ